MGVWFDSADRSGLPMTGMILLSLLLHGALLAFLIVSPSFPTPKRTFGTVYDVSLVSTPAAVMEHRRSSTAAKELLDGVSRPRAAVIKKRLEPAPVIPLRSLKAPPKTDPSLNRVLEEIRKKVASGVSSPKSETAKKEDAPPAAPAAPPGAEGNGDARQEAYYALLWSRIKGQWALPSGILSGESLEAVVGISLLRSGTVTAISFEKRSGNRYFDDSVLKAIEKAAPFPPLPDGVGGKHLEVGIRFHSAELGR